MSKSGKSFRSIHYVLRPAKNVERKLIADTVVRLGRMMDTASLRYIGLGSVYFADFSMYHRRLGFSEMHSIEVEAKDSPEIQARCEFNKPFSINLHFDHSSEVLPRLTWDRQSMVWLDYDDPLTGEMLSDLEYVVGATLDPSIVLVSVNVQAGPDIGRRKRLIDEVGEDYMPSWARNDAALAQDNYRKAVKQIITSKIDEVLRDRNGVLSRDQKIHYRQLFNYSYQDGAKMLTVGGILYRSSFQEMVDACKLDELAHVKTGDKSFEITIPLLTIRERLHLDSQIPIGQPLSAPGLDPEQLSSYARLYRHLPAFLDAEL